MFSLEGITTSVQDWLFMKFNPTIALAMECVIVILLSISLIYQYQVSLSQVYPYLPLNPQSYFLLQYDLVQISSKTLET